MKARIHRGSWIVTVPVAAAAAAYVGLVFLPGNRAIGEARRQIEQKQDYLSRSAGLPMALRDGYEELQKAESYVADWDRRSPAPGGRSALHGRIQALAKAAGVTTTRFDPDPIEPYAEICKIPITVGCSGSFAQICRFIESLEREGLEIWIDLANLEKMDETGGSVTCELKLVVFANNPDISDYARGSE